jgi:L-ascorbate metabolism protein UlaG (beta-lactamase superfamily)
VVAQAEVGDDLKSRQQAAGRRQKITRVAALLVLAAIFLLPKAGFSFCHELEVVRAPLLRVAAANNAPVLIEWFGHSTFQITSSKGTRILTDPHGRDDLPWPSLPQDVVTSSHPHGPHANFWMAKGNPVVLEGLTPGGENWRNIHTSIRDVSVYTVPAYHDKSQGLQRGKNAIFVFRVDDICIAHPGDLGHHLTPAQLKMLGKIDIFLVPIAGGFYTVTPEEAREVTAQVNPRIAIPMHYDWEGAVREYIRDNQRVRRLDGAVLKISKQELPPPTEIVVLSGRYR